MTRDTSPSGLRADTASLSNDARLAAWEQVMAQACAAMRRGHTLAALAACHEALALSRSLADEPPAGRADDALAARVVSRHQLADLHADAGCVDLAAAQRCRAHEELMLLLPGAADAAGLRHAALRHSRETHAALLLHLAEHGDHPAIRRALRTGCLALRAGHDTLH